MQSTAFSKAVRDFNTAVAAANAGDAGTALGAARDALTAARTILTELTDPGRPLENARDALTKAARDLRTAAIVDHTGFQIRASVSPGDEEYVVVVAMEDPADPPVPTTHWP